MIHDIESLLQQSTTPIKANFYKTGKGDYAEHDKFIGVPVPALRDIAKKFNALSLCEIEALISSPFNEKRLLALFILIDQYQKSDSATKSALYQFYMSHLKHVNNWNLVDSSAHLILGAHLLKSSDRDLLISLAKSNILWERRIAIIATWQFIRHHDLEWTFKISEILLNDSHDLIHKAVGWMLREAGKQDKDSLIKFLDQHSQLMPRTMLRYAIERFPHNQKAIYLRTSRI